VLTDKVFNMTKTSMCLPLCFNRFAQTQSRSEGNVGFLSEFAAVAVGILGEEIFERLLWLAD
jgi:hypothetical protein